MLHFHIPVRPLWILVPLCLLACGPEDPASPGLESSRHGPLLDKSPQGAGEQEFLVRLAAGFGDEDLEGIPGLQVLQSLLDLVRLDSDLTEEQLEEIPFFATVQANSAVTLSNPVDLTMSFYEGGISSELTGQDALRSLAIARAHRVARGADVKVAVLDTGVDVDHPLLQGRLEFSAQSLPPGMLDVDEQADGIDQDGDGWFDEAHGHGTHVAGIIATLAPEATLLPLRVLDDDGVGTSFDLALALRAAQEEGADIVNLSLSLDAEAHVVRQIVDELHQSGVLVVAAGGNTSGSPQFPADQTSTLGVAATDPTGRVLETWSARGLDLDLAAPGTDIVSAFPGGQWAQGTGTSMACAVVSGSLALVVEARHGPVPAARSRLLATADALDPGDAARYGALDLDRALATGMPDLEVRISPRP